MRIATITLSVVLLLSVLLIGGMTTAAYAVDGPDLTISSVTYDAVAHRVDVVVRNAGNMTTNLPQPFSCYLDLFVDPAGPPQVGSFAPPGMYTKIQSPLDPGASVVIQFPVSLVGPVHTLYAIVDTDRKVPNEANFANNVYGPVHIGGTGQPDLIIESMTDNGGSIDVVVKNQGNAPVVAPFYVDYFRDPIAAPRTGDWSNIYRVVKELPAQQSVTLAFPRPTRWAFAIVDSDNMIAEQNEANNLFGPMIVTFDGTGDPDVLIKNITYNAGTQQVTVTVTNIGTKTTTDPVPVDLFVDPAQDPVYKDASTTSVTTDTALSPGQTTQVVIDSPLAPGTEPHVLWAIVNTTEVIAETDAGKLNDVYGPKPILVTNAPGADVAIAGIPSYDPATGIVSVLVRNKGNQAVENDFSVSLFVLQQNDPKPVLGDASNLIAFVPAGLAIGSQKTAKIQTNLAPGNYSIVAVADTEGTVSADLDLTNNISPSIPITVAAHPDWTADLKTVLAYDASLQQAIVTVSNIGTGMAGPFDTRLYVDPDIDPTWQQQRTYSLDKGATVTMTFDLALDSKLHVLKASADPEGWVIDKNRANNDYTLTAVSGLADGPDLIVTDIRYDRTDHTAYVKVKNQGTPVTGQFSVALWVDYDRLTPPQVGDTNYDGSAVWTGLGANSEVEIGISLPLSLSLGDHHLRAIVDNGQQITEGPSGGSSVNPQELNNIFDKDPLTLAPVDSAELVVTGIYFDPADGYHVVIQNQGTVDIKHYFYVDVFADLTTPPVVGNEGIGFYYVSDITAGESKDLRIALNVDENQVGGAYWPGDHTIYAIVDTNRWILEYSENNNIGGPISVTVE